MPLGAETGVNGANLFLTHSLRLSVTSSTDLQGTSCRRPVLPLVKRIQELPRHCRGGPDACTPICVMVVWAATSNAYRFENYAVAAFVSQSTGSAAVRPDVMDVVGRTDASAAVDALVVDKLTVLRQFVSVVNAVHRQASTQRLFCAGIAIRRMLGLRCHRYANQECHFGRA